MHIPQQHYLIVDLEATCSDDGAVPRHEMEIIEIGAVMLHATSFEIESEFQTFIRPVRHPQLTAITQQDLADAPHFAEAMDAMTSWMRDYPDALFCSWGGYDRNQFHQDC